MREEREGSFSAKITSRNTNSVDNVDAYRDKRMPKGEGRKDGLTQVEKINSYALFGTESSIE